MVSLQEGISLALTVQDVVCYIIASTAYYHYTCRITQFDLVTITHSLTILLFRCREIRRFIDVVVSSREDQISVKPDL